MLNQITRKEASLYPFSSHTPDAAQQGKSTVSPIASATTAATVPGPPPAPRIVGLDRTAAELKWGSPAADGGSPVTQHQLEMRPKCATAIEAGIPDEWLLVYQVRSPQISRGVLGPGPMS